MYIYLVKEVQYEWVRVLAAYSNEKKAIVHCNELLAEKRKIGVINFIVETHKVID